MSSSFSYKLIAEDEQFTFDFKPILATGETILTAACTIIVVDGTDPNPNNIKVGSPSISGTKVAQRIFAGLDGVTYRLVMTITTSLTNTYSTTADLPVYAPDKV